MENHSVWLIVLKFIGLWVLGLLILSGYALYTYRDLILFQMSSLIEPVLTLMLMVYGLYLIVKSAFR